MANTQRNFIKGVMNKSIDERLLPNGQYVDALNVRLGSTEDSEIGSVENSKGNTQLTELQYNGDALSADARCIGAYEDGANETLYWFIHDSNFTPSPTGKLDLIVSLNVQTNILTYIVKSIDDGGGVNTTLNFNPQYLITGVNLVDEKLLFFTDDINPPRFVNVDRSYPNPVANVDDVNLAEALLVIKKPPLDAPNITPQVTASQNNFIEDRFICFGYRYEYADGEYSATSQFSEPAFLAGAFDYNFSTGLNDGMLNSAQQVRIEYMSGGPLVVGVDLLWKDMTNGIIRVIEKLDKAQLGLVDDTLYDYSFSNSKIYTVLPSSEILRLYDNVPRLAKAQTIMGNRLFYGNYLEQYDVDTRLDYFVGKVSEDVGLEDVPETLSQGDYFFDSGATPLPYPVNDSIVEFDFQGVDLVAGSLFEFTLQFEHSQFTGTVTPSTTTGPTTISFQYILPQDFSSASDLATSTDFVEKVGLIGTSVEPVSNACNGTSFTDEFNCIIPASLDLLTKRNSGIGSGGVQSAIAISSTPTTIGFQLLSMYFEDPSNAANNAYEYYKILSAEGLYQKLSSPKSLHSNRSYEVGIIYMDEFNRATTALVSPNNTMHIPCADSSTANYISVNIPPTQVAPDWATRYKFCIKADKEDYFNVYSSFFFRDPETSADYFLLEGQNAQKVDEGDILLVKSDTSGPLNRCVYATVLEKQSQQKDFISFTDRVIPQGVYMKIRANNFSTAFEDDNIIDYGVESDQGTGCKDIFYPIDEDDGSGGFVDYTIPAGSRIRIYIDNLREGKGNTIRREWFVDTTFVSPLEYPNFESWFVGQNINIALEAQETAVDCTGPNFDLSGLLPCKAGNISSTIMPHPTTGRNCFVVRSSEGKVGVKRKNVSIRVQIVVERAPSLIVFETEPQDALPDVWYESSESFPIVTESGICEFTLRVNPPEPNPIQFDYIDINGLPQSVIVPNDGTIVGDGQSKFVGVCSSIVTNPSTPPVDPANIDILSTTLSEGSHIGNILNQNISTGASAVIRTDFFNCYAFGNGVESYAIRDAIGKNDLSLGNRVTSTSAQDYEEVRRFADLTYSGVFNDESNVNKLNEFNLGLLNFKPLEESYGPIYLIDGRETDILTLQEDKVSYVLQGKNILTDSTGGGQVASVPEVLGQQVARIEDYGVSFHPESYTKWGPNKFFTDSKRGAVIQLRGAGTSESLSVISESGMRSWFRDLFLESFNTQKLGGFDPYMNEYVLSSNSELLPSVVECIECGISRSLVVTDSEPTTFCVDVGFLVGDVSIEYNVLGDGQSPFEIESTYNSVVDTTGVTSVSGTLTVDKDSVVANTINLSITSQGSTHLEITVNCPDAQQLTIIQVCYSLDDDAGLFIHNEYSWTDGTFISPLHSEQVELVSGTSNPLISQYTQIVGPQGSGFIPADGATVSIITNKIGVDDYVFDPSIDELRYLRSNTFYANTPAQMQTLFNASNNATPLVSSNGGNTYTAEFTMPSSTDEYLYLIYNYRRPTDLELCYDASSEFAVCCECTVAPSGYVNRKSLSIDGVNQYVKFSDTTGFPEIADMTISCWFFNNGDDGIDRYIWGGITSSNRYVYCRQSNTNQILVAVRNGDIAGILNFISNVPVNAWTHLTVTWESDGIGNLFEQKVYLNGVLAGTDSDTSFTPSNANFFPSVFAIGEYENATTGPSGTPFDAPIDQVVLWSVVLSPSEIKELVQLRDIEDHSQYGSVTNWYEFEDDDIVGTTLTDRAGTEDGTLINGATNTVCIPYPYPYQVGYGDDTILQLSDGGWSWDFDGVNDYITYPTSPFLGSSAFSLSIWINQETLANEWAIYKLNEFELAADSSSLLYFRAYDTSASNFIQVALTSYTPPEENWIHVVVTCNGNGSQTGLALYVNGIAFTQTKSFLGTYTQMQNTGNALSVSKPTAGFKSRMTDFIMWDKELSSAEVLEIYNYNSPRNEMSESLSSNITGYWRGRNSSIGSGAVLDMSTNSNNGTMTNMTESDIVYQYPRKAFDLANGNEGSFKFDGSTQYVNVPNSSDLTFTNGATVDDAFTVAFWINTDDIASNDIIVKSNEFLIGGDSSSRYYLRLYTDATNYLSVRTDTSYTADKWQFIAITYDANGVVGGVGSIVVYVDGDEGSSTDEGSIGTYTGMTNTGNPIQIGDTAEMNMNGVTFFNRVLTGCEIGELYNSGSPINISNFTASATEISHWRMDATDDPTGTVTDTVGSNNGTATNMTAGSLETDNYPTN